MTKKREFKEQDAEESAAAKYKPTFLCRKCGAPNYGYASGQILIYPARGAFPPVYACERAFCVRCGEVPYIWHNESMKPGIFAARFPARGGMEADFNPAAFNIPEELCADAETGKFSMTLKIHRVSQLIRLILAEPKETCFYHRQILDVEIAPAKTTASSPPLFSGEPALYGL